MPCMPETHTDPLEDTYPLRAAARITGLSPELLRAWERRYAVVVPLRTPGGTRRYRAADLEKLRLAKAAVDSGHRISHVAQMDDEELKRCAQNLPASSRSTSQIEEVLNALTRLDSSEAQRLLSMQLSTLGPVRFARQIARPLVHEIGSRWERDELSMAAEHMATAILRAMFGTALQPTVSSQLGPRILFSTPSGERHELGLQMAALTALGAGANPIFIGADLPVEELAGALDQTGAVGVALSLVTISPSQAQTYLAALRGAVPKSVRIWIGGHATHGLEPIDGVDLIQGLDDFERRIALLGYENTTRPTH